MRFRLVRVIRGGRTFPNGVFDLFDDAVKAMENGQRWHKANGTSTKFRIEDAETGEEVKQAPVQLLDYDETPAPPEEDAELRILQLEEELEKAKKALKAKQVADGEE